MVVLLSPFMWLANQLTDAERGDLFYRQERVGQRKRRAGDGRGLLPAQDPTGRAAPYGASVNDALLKRQYDLYYIRHQDLYLDMLILQKTAQVILGLKGREMREALIPAPSPGGRRELCPPGWSPEQMVSFLKGLVAAEPGVLAGRLATTPLGAEEADWLQRQRLAPYAFHRLQEMGLLPQLPEAAQTALRSAYYGAVTQYTLLSVELEALLAEFRKRGIEPIMLKGMAVCSTAYPSPGTRPASDLDVLIEYSQVETIRQLLTARGYRDKGLDQGQHIAFAHHLHMWRESFGGHHMVVEAHWELVHDPGYARRLDVRGFMARAQRIDSPDGAALALDPTDQLIHACAHLSLHHPQEWSLLWLLDLRLLVTRWGTGWDWSELVGRAEQYKLAGTLRYWLELAEAWYGPFLPPQAVRALAAAHMFPEEHWYIATARAGYARQWEFVWRRAWDAPNLSQTLTFIRQTLFPPWTYMRYRYGARSRWLAPPYYGWRFIRAGLAAFRRIGSG